MTTASPGRTKWWSGEWTETAGRVPFAVIVYLLVKYHEGMDSVVRIHDSLDSYQPTLQRMSLGDLFAGPDSTLDFMLGGVPRSTAGSEFFLGNWIAALLPLVASLVVAEAIYRLIGYYGFRRLLRAVGFGGDRLVMIAVPSMFAILPVWHPGFAGVTGVPLLLSALIRLGTGGTRTDYLIVALFPLISPIALTVPYALVMSGVVVVGFVSRSMPRRVMAAVGSFLLVAVVVEWRQLYSAVSGPTSHRVEMAGGPPDLSVAVFKLGRRALELIEKQGTGLTLHVTVLSALLILGVLLWSVISRSSADRGRRVLWASGAGCAGLVVVGTGWRYLDRALRNVIGDYPLIQIDRVLFLCQVLLYLGLAAAAVILGRRLRAHLILPLLAVVFAIQFAANWNEADFRPGVWEQTTLRQYFEPDLFDEIRAAIPPDERVASVGLHPGVSIWNGLDAADGYVASYPLEYKHAWRALIAPALERDDSLREYFDLWGSRAYVLQPGVVVEPVCCGPVERAPIELLIDAGALDDLGVGHLLSTREIDNQEQLGLRLVDLFEKSGSTYTIWLYER